MAAIFYSLVRRHMKLTSPGAFTRAEAGTSLPVEIQLEAGESVVGWYQNPPPREGTLIVFSTEAIYVASGSAVKRIVADEIVDYERPPSKKTVTGVTVVTANESVFVPVAGAFGVNENQKDAFCFIMVLRGLLTVTRPGWRAPREAT
jgi:hypothetical protein